MSATCSKALPLKIECSEYFYLLDYAVTMQYFIDRVKPPTPETLVLIKKYERRPLEAAGARVSQSDKAPVRRSGK